jgi:hypothetical protein
MPEEVSGIPRVAIERSHRDFPRRDGQQQGNRRQKPRQPEPEIFPPVPAPGDEGPRIGTRLNVRA